MAIKAASGVRLAMQVTVAAAAAWWLLFFFFQPITTTNKWEKMINNKVNSKFLSMRGSTFLLQVLPIIVIAFLSYIILELRRRLTKPTAKFRGESKPRRISRDLWTCPIFLRSPLGMLTLGDLAFLLCILFIVFWYFTKFAVKVSNEIDHKTLKPGMPTREMQKLWQIGILCGNTAMIPMALLWLPVARGSPILQVVGVPFERAVKYHTWLGYLTVWLLIAHGALLTVCMVHQQKAHELITWSTEGVSVSIVAGVVALAAGIIMMFTALGPVRRKFYHLFFAIHHLYPVFAIFFFFHTVVKVPYFIVPLLIFLMDRFIRAVQSRRSVEVLSANLQESGVIELKFAKAANTTYHALSFLYMLIPSVSKAEWHPFSVASSPLDGTNEITVYIKPVGGFTKNVHDMLISANNSNKQGRDFYKCPFSCKVGVEGPYGDESAFYLGYEKLVMVAGGIGVTPFIAILKDILHRHRLGQHDLPDFIELIFCVRNPRELKILDSLSPSSILPGYAQHLQITIRPYITSSIADDDSILQIGEETSEQVSYYGPNVVVPSRNSSAASLEPMSNISSSGHSAWVAAIFSATIVGFFVINGIFNIAVLEKWNLPNYVRVLMYLASFTGAVVVFGGAVLLLWALVERRAQIKSQVASQSSTSSSSDQDTRDLITPRDASWWENDDGHRRGRPVWKDIFSDMAKRFPDYDVGVLVSGASGMQEEVARECRHYTLSRESGVVMHYRSVSFEL